MISYMERVARVDKLEIDTEVSLKGCIKLLLNVGL
jgi:hypothetical protein